MSREEAATVYLDVLLGFRDDYGTFRQAADVLAEIDRMKIESAVFIRLSGGRISASQRTNFLGSQNENECQFLLGGQA